MGKAAEELAITQSALSQTISRLEKDLGVTLFERRGRNIVLSSTGKHYWQQVNYAIRSLEVAEEELLLAAKGIGGHINIGFTFVVGSIFFPKLMHDFLSIPDHEKITFSTLQGDSPEIISAVKEGRCDVGFGTYFKDEPRLKFVSAFRQDLVLAVPENHPLTEKKKILCEDLLQYPFISFRRNHTLYNQTMQYFEANGVPVHPSYEVTEETTMAGMVASDLGIGFIPDSQLLDSFPIKRLKVIGAPTSRYLYMCFLAAPYIQSPAAKSFISYVMNTRKLSRHSS